MDIYLILSQGNFAAGTTGKGAAVFVEAGMPQESTRSRDRQKVPYRARIRRTFSVCRTIWGNTIERLSPRPAMLRVAPD